MLTTPRMRSEAGQGLSFLVPDWPAPLRVRALTTTRTGGISEGLYASLNFGDHVGDDPAAVAGNRALLRAHLPAEPAWLCQVHGVAVVDAGEAPSGAEADASVARRAGVVSVVMTADCLPVLFCDEAGSVVGAAHAGWRSLVGGVLENTVSAMGVPASRVLAWLGPAIGQPAFEVGEEVRAAFLAHDPAASAAFLPGAGPGKWQADLYRLARQRLAAIGLTRVFGGGLCTYSDPQRFFSARRDGTRSGRLASLIWLI